MDYKIVRSFKRRTLSLQVDRQGILVRAPAWISERDIRLFVESHREWIERQKKKFAALPPEPETEKPAPDEIKRLKTAARKWFAPRVDHYAALMGVTPGKLSFRAMTSRWGSCNVKGDISINVLLMEAPPEVRDAVIVHELCHILRRDHSREFYSLVRTYCPDYDARYRWLRDHGAALAAKIK